MAGKVRTWVWVLVAVLVVIVLGLVAIAGVGFYFVSRHMETTSAGPADAAAEFDSVRGRFDGQRPLLELDSRGHVVRARREPPPAGARATPSELHVLGFDPGSSRIVRFKAPFWLLRMGGGKGRINVNGGTLTFEELGLTVEDLERHGPALLLDHVARDGERVIAWTQ